MSTTSCQSPLNADISGVGVRLSFYLQTLFLGFLSSRSGSIDEISGALYTLMATNGAMAVTGLILGLKPAPEIVFQDAIIIIYLLTMSWCTVIGSLALCNGLAEDSAELSEDTAVLQLVSVVQGYLILAFDFVVLAEGATFGQNPACDKEAVVVLFARIPARRGRILGWVIVSLMTAGHSFMSVVNFWKTHKRRDRKKALALNPREAPPMPVNIDSAGPGHQFAHSPSSLQTPGKLERQSTAYNINNNTARGPFLDPLLISMLLWIIVFWIFLVVHTELVIRFNSPTLDNDGPSWQFGQILPVFLSLLPFISMVNVFKNFRLKPIKIVRREMEIAIIYDRGFEE